ncbi:MAG: PhnD/SsuA/transferrin family substrate-binding protein [Sulfuriferula sp.]|nr:PhnD/SsuA/transferrin family substrate-binding protein [Sulfuriferula sp.]
MINKIILVGLLCASGVASADLTLAIVRNPDESYADYDISSRYNNFIRQVRQTAGMPVNLVQFKSAFDAAKRGKHGDFDIVLAPSHTIASLLHAKFVPIAETQEKFVAVFVVADGSKITSLADARGARVAMPNSESLLAAQVKGELNLQNIRPKSYFASFTYHQFDGTALFALGNHSFDVAVANENDAKAWIAQHGGRIIYTMPSTPVQGVAVSSSVPATVQTRIQNALLKNAATMHLVAASDKDFARIGSMLNTTPLQLAGAKVVTVADARSLMGQGVPVYDVRNVELYRQAHVPHAILVEYKEVSAKEVDFDASLDSFDLSKLPADKSKPFIMYCDGTACWKSYKSASAAIKAGYRNIYWMRGGIPDWKDAGYPVEQD